MKQQQINKLCSHPNVDGMDQYNEHQFDQIEINWCQYVRQSFQVMRHSTRDDVNRHCHVIVHPRHLLVQELVDVIKKPTESGHEQVICFRGEHFEIVFRFFVQRKLSFSFKLLKAVFIVWSFFEVFFFIVGFRGKMVLIKRVFWILFVLRCRFRVFQNLFKIFRE